MYDTNCKGPWAETREPKTVVTLVSTTADPQSLATVTLKKRRQLATSELLYGKRCEI